jgi:WXG100 family type VII secretion target
MGDQLLVVNFYAMSDAANRISNASTLMDEQLSALNAKVSAVSGTVESSWSGAAQDAYRARQDEWNAAAGELRNVLARLGKAVTDARDLMAMTESRHANNMSKGY